MSRNALNFVIDIATGLLMAGMIATGLIMHMVLPAGMGRHYVLWGLGRHSWGTIHFWLAMVLLLVLVVHLAIHWQWICTMFSRWIGRERSAMSNWRFRATAGVSLLVLTMIGFVGFTWTARQHVVDVRPARQETRVVQAAHPQEADLLEHRPIQRRLRGARLEP